MEDDGTITGARPRHGDTIDPARSVVEGLVERGFLERRGERGAPTYHLSAAIYRRLGQKSAYVRIRGFEPEQQRQMIIQYENNRAETSALVFLAVQKRALDY
ncbi:MAG TPA: hypothetical protein GX509_00395 [Firmicutes bacterium]|nr:hypothetical protein [Bacillota bacterium]